MQYKVIYQTKGECKKMNECMPVGININDTGFGYTMSLISGKYKFIILYWLAN